MRRARRAAYPPAMAVLYVPTDSGSTDMPAVVPGRATVVGQQSGTFEITGGTGEFAGASGSATFSGEGRVVFRRTEQGCALDQPPLVDVLRVNLIGQLTA